MTPIIPPIWLYWIEALAAIESLAIAITVIFSILLAAYAIFAFIYWMDEEEEPPMPEKWMCILFCAILILSILAIILVPSQETMIYMTGLSFVTPDNVEYGVEIVKSVFDYVIAALNT